MPTPMAIHLAEATDPRTCADGGYIIKSALSEAFADGAVRPWRIIGYDSELIEIIGCVDGAKVSNNAKSRKLGIIVEPIDFDFAVGQTFDINVQAAAVRRIRLGESRNTRRFADAGATFVEGSLTDLVETPRSERSARWTPWLLETLARADRGLTVIDIPEAAGTTEIRRQRKVHGKVLPFVVPCIDSRLTVRVTDIAAFRAAVAQGIGKFKDVGLGSIIPTEILEDAA